MAKNLGETFEELYEGVKELPGTWGPRREQPEWDRDFSGKAEILASFQHKTDKAADWMRWTLRFSHTLVEGYEGLENVRKTGRAALSNHLPKGKKQF
jgi:hypothetical protein